MLLVFVLAGSLAFALVALAVLGTERALQWTREALWNWRQRAKMRRIYGPLDAYRKPGEPVAFELHVKLRERQARGLSLAMLVFGLLLFGVSASGCSWWSSNQKQVVSDVGQVGSCILSQLFQGQSDPGKVAAACAPATIADVDQIILSLLDYYAGGDGGAPAASADPAFVKRLQAAHAAAQAKKGQ